MLLKFDGLCKFKGFLADTDFFNYKSFYYVNAFNNAMHLEKINTDFTHFGAT